jgi:membrane-anchored protein YejM (alkaline phosphatase superfamily)
MLLADPVNQQKALRFLEKVCSVFTLIGDDNRYKSCIQTIDSTVNRVLSGVNGLEPTKFCQSVHVCKAQSKRTFDWPGFGAIRDQACNLCHKTLSTLDSLLENSNNEQKVRNVLEKFCIIGDGKGDDLSSFNDIGSKEYNECAQKVDREIHSVMTDLAENKLQSNKFCHNINICRT